MDPLTKEAKDLERLYSTINAPNDVGIKEIEPLYPLCWKIDEHCSNASEFVNDIMQRIQKVSAEIYS
jgi:hypothetical protein